LKKIQKMALSLNISYEKAEIIHKMSQKKGIRSKTIEEESEDEELKLNKTISNFV